MSTSWGKKLVPWPVAVDYPPTDLKIAKLLGGFLAVFFAGMTVLIFLSVGPSPFAFFFPAAAGGLFWISATWVKNLRAGMILVFDSEGVALNGGRRFPWSALQRVELRTMQNVGRKWVHRIDLLFGGERVFVGIRARNFDGAVDFVRRLPVEQRETPLT